MLPMIFPEGESSGDSSPPLQKKSKIQDDEEKARNLDKMFTDLKTIAVRVREHNARNGNGNDFSFDTLQSSFPIRRSCGFICLIYPFNY